MNWLDLLIVVALLLLLAVITGPFVSDYDFGEGRMRCGVAGLTPSCGSIFGKDVK